MTNNENDSDDYLTVSETESSEQSTTELIEDHENLSETETVTDNTLKSTKRPLPISTSSKKLTENTPNTAPTLVDSILITPKEKIKIVVRDITGQVEENTKSTSEAVSKPSNTGKALEITQNRGSIVTHWDRDLFKSHDKLVNLRAETRFRGLNRYHNSRIRDSETNEYNIQKRQKDYAQPGKPTSLPKNMVYERTIGKDYRSLNKPTDPQQPRAKIFVRESKISDNIDYRIIDGVVDKISVISLTGNGKVEDTSTNSGAIVSNNTKNRSEQKPLDRAPAHSYQNHQKYNHARGTYKNNYSVPVSSTADVHFYSRKPPASVSSAQPQLRFTNANSHPANMNNQPYMPRYRAPLMNRNPRPFDPSFFPNVNPYYDQYNRPAYNPNYFYPPPEPLMYQPNMYPAPMDPMMGMGGPMSDMYSYNQMPIQMPQYQYDNGMQQLYNYSSGQFEYGPQSTYSDYNLPNMGYYPPPPPPAGTH